MLPKISGCLIVKNEENNLPRCLKSLSPFVDELIIVDTGSTDTTKQVVQEFTSQLFHFDWCDDFAAARNFALGKTSGDWILTLDADEELIATSEQNLFREFAIIEESDLGDLSEVNVVFLFPIEVSHPKVSFERVDHLVEVLVEEPVWWELILTGEVGQLFALKVIATELPLVVTNDNHFAIFPVGDVPNFGVSFEIGCGKPFLGSDINEHIVDEKPVVRVRDSNGWMC